MAKRPNRLPPIQHEQRQLESLKTMEPNTTPDQYQALSNGLVDVSIAALAIVGALESQGKPDFERLYDLVDGLADLVDGDTSESDESEPIPASAPAAPATPVKPVVPQTGGITTMKTTIIGRPDRVEVTGDTITLYMQYTPKPGANGQYSLPKGVPAPKDISTPVIAYVGRKQFDKVKGQLDNPDDALIIEGGMSQVVNGVLTVYATNITSKLLQTAKAEQQKAAAQPSEQ